MLMVQLTFQPVAREVGNTTPILCVLRIAEDNDGLIVVLAANHGKSGSNSGIISLPLILSRTLEDTDETAPAVTAVPWEYPPAASAAFGHCEAARVKRLAIVLIAESRVPLGRKLDAKSAAIVSISLRMMVKGWKTYPDSQLPAWRNSRDTEGKGPS